MNNNACSGSGYVFEIIQKKRAGYENCMKDIFSLFNDIVHAKDVSYLLEQKVIPLSIPALIGINTFSTLFVNLKVCMCALTVKSRTCMKVTNRKPS